MEGNDDSFSFGKRAVSLLIVQTGAISLVAVASLLTLVLCHNLGWFGRRRFKFLRRPIDYFFLGLLICDFIRAVGHVTGIAWVVEGRISAGPTCTAEAILRHVGAVGETFFTLTIGIYTFVAIYLRYDIPNTRLLSFGVIGAISLFLILMVSISVPTHREPPFYGPAGLWCWIDNAYRAERIGLKYGIFWMVALINICLYVPLFWSLRRDGQNQSSQSTTTSGRESVSIASKMLVYPIAYIFLVLPMSIIRWIVFTRPNVHVGTGWIALAGITFGSSGLVNSLLYIITRPGLLPSFHKKDECTCCGNSVALRDVESGDPNRRIGLDDDD